MAHSVFISYARHDSHQMRRVRGIVASLAPSDSVFVDSHSIAPGADWQEALVRALSTTEIFFVVWTEHALRSKWVLKEVEIALALNSASGVPRIVPLSFDGVQDTALLSAFQSVDMGPNLPERGHSRVVTLGIVACGGLTAASIFQVNVPLLSSAVLVASTWIAVASFSGLRKSAAPWSSGPLDQVSILFGAIAAPRPVVVALLVASALAATGAALHLAMGRPMV